MLRLHWCQLRRSETGGSRTTLSYGEDPAERPNGHVRSLNAPARQTDNCLDLDVNQQQSGDESDAAASPFHPLHGASPYPRLLRLVVGVHPDHEDAAARPRDRRPKHLGRRVAVVDPCLDGHRAGPLHRVTPALGLGQRSRDQGVRLGLAVEAAAGVGVRIPLLLPHGSRSQETRSTVARTPDVRRGSSGPSLQAGRPLTLAT